MVTADPLWVTSGNSGLPRLNSSWKSSDIPLPTQSPIWVNPMGPFTLSFGKKCYNVTTPGDNLQISSTKRAFVECMFLPHRLRSLHQGYFPDLIDCRPVFMSTKFVLSRVHMPPASYNNRNPALGADMPLLRVNTEISVFYTPSLCCLRILNYLRILLISLKKY